MRMSIAKMKLVQVIKGVVSYLKEEGEITKQGVLYNLVNLLDNTDELTVRSRKEGIASDFEELGISEKTVRKVRELNQAGKPLRPEKPGNKPLSTVNIQLIHN